MTENRAASYNRKPRSTWTFLLLGALAIASVVMFLALGEEPYHIDELRQTRSYVLPLDQVVDASFAQDQPPLDPVLNSIVQKALGIGDRLQRALSALFALGGFAIFGFISRRAGFKRGAPFGVLVLALSPLLLSVFAYARPYALPFFLTMAFLLSADYWLTERAKLAVPLLFLLALLLPLSRTIEPNIVLGAVALVLVVLRLVRGADRFSGSVWVPVGASLLGIGAVGLPVLLRLRGQLTGYTRSGLLPSQEQVSRLVTDLPEALASSVPVWPAAVIVVITALASKQTRTTLARTWWAWVLLILPAMFSLGFLLTTNPSQPLFLRYMFTWIPLLALAVTAVMSEVALQRPRRYVALAGAVATVVLIVGAAIQVVSDYGSTQRGDWEALSTVIETATADDSLVVLENLRPLGLHRTRFEGQPRYLSPDRKTVFVLLVVRQPELIGEDEPIVIAISGPPLTVPGWERIPVDQIFWVYVPDTPVRRPIEVADTFLTFSEMVGSDSGATLALAGASLYLANGQESKGCTIINELRDDESLIERVDIALAGGAVVDWSTTCLALG